MRCSGSAVQNKEFAMPDQKVSLEDILDQYSPENEIPKTSVGRVDAQKIINSTVEAPDMTKKAEQRRNNLCDGICGQ